MASMTLTPDKFSLLPIGTSELPLRVGGEFLVLADSVLIPCSELQQNH